jgi:hypothetical protein
LKFFFVRNEGSEVITPLFAVFEWLNQNQVVILLTAQNWNTAH